MNEIRQTAEYREWFDRLKDIRAKMRIDARLRRLALGNRGDVKYVGRGIWEMRIDSGPGYRVCFAWRGDQVVLLLAGGDKSSQSGDIRRAQALAEQTPGGD